MAIAVEVCARHVREVWDEIGCKPIANPIEQNEKLRFDVGEVLEDATLYRKVVGS